MATNNQLKFYRLGATAMASKVVSTGAIWFNTDDKTIQIKTATGWDKYAGKLNDAQWDANKAKLTISKYDGSSIELDFSDIASGSSVTAAMNALESKLQGEIDAIEAAVGLSEAGAYVAPAGDTFKDTTSVKGALEALDSAISKVSGDLTGGISGRVDAVEGRATALEAKDVELGNAITDITKDGGAIATAVAAEAAIARAAEQAAEASAAAALAAAQGAQAHSEGVAGNLASEISRVESLVTAEAGRADAAEKANAAAAKSAQDAADAAQGYAEGVNTALSVEVERATGAEGDLSDRIDALAAAETGRVSVLEAQVAALNAATHFEGKVEGETFEAAVAASGKTFDAGDIVIYGNKEFIYDGSAWIELGDTTAESNRITTLEGEMDVVEKGVADNKAAIESNDADILALQNRAKAIEDTMATDAEVEDLIAGVNGTLDEIDEALGGYGDRIQGLEDLTADFEHFASASEYAADKAAYEQVHTDLNAAIALKAAQSSLDTTNGIVDCLVSQIGEDDSTHSVDYTGTNYLTSASTLVAADKALDAKIKEVADSVANKNVAAEGDEYVTATAEGNTVTISAHTGTVESKDGLATNQGVYDALCWVEFE